MKPNEAVFVDDFLINIEGCEKVGMKGIHFKDPKSALKQLKKLLSTGHRCPGCFTSNSNCPGRCADMTALCQGIARQDKLSIG